MLLRPSELVVVVALGACAPGGATDGPTPDGATDSAPAVETDSGLPIDDSAATDAPLGDTDLPPTQLELVAAPGCADPSARTAARFDVQTFAVDQGPKAHLAGGGSAVADLDGDGDVDIVIVANDEVVLLRTTDTGYRREQLMAATHAEPWIGLFGVAAADFDGDGDVDLLITGLRRPNHLLRNRGDGAFDDVIAGSGLDVIPDWHATASGTWHDINGDGWLDLFVAGHGFLPEEGAVPGTVVEFDQPHRSFLFLNDRDGTFTDVSEWLDERVHGGYSFTGAFVDVDEDGADDLYFTNDFGRILVPCHVAMRRGDRFVMVDDPALNLDAHGSCMGMGAGQLGEFDTTESLTLPATAESWLFQKRDGRWYSTARLRGFRPTIGQVSGLSQRHGWGGEIVDMDNDGLNDVLVAFGRLDTNLEPEDPFTQPDALYIQDQTGKLTDEATAWGIADVGTARNLNPADLNRDGWMDLIRVDLAGKADVLIQRCSSNAWLQVALEHVGHPNPSGIGATIKVTAGRRVWFQRLRGGGTGYGSTRLIEAHFGLGGLDAVESLEVQWPDGVVDRWEDLDTRQRVVVRRWAVPPGR